jgi:pSer/pThr/pTyr-binding forkhead associated (FHA) protein
LPDVFEEEEGTMRVKLKVLRGASEGKEIEIRGSQFLIGRSEECNLRANSDAISRKHCEIRIVGPEVRVRDLGSRNGTFVNGNKLDGPQIVDMGDQLRIGPLEFLVTVTDRVRGPAKTPQEQPVGTEDLGGLISDWLTEADEENRRVPTERETREYRFDQAESALTDTTVNSSSDKTQEIPRVLPDSSHGKKKEEKGKGHPPRKNAPKDTQEAAAQTLRKFFNRG